MKFNFFDWIREGVKQSVLLGLADAAEQIATPGEADQLNQRFLSTFETGGLIGGQSGQKGGARTRRKALGRSLSTIMEEDHVT